MRPKSLVLLSALLALAMLDRAEAGDFFVAENPAIGYYFETGRPSSIMRKQRQRSDDRTDLFASADGKVSVQVWRLDGELSYEQCAAETYIDRRLTPLTHRAGADTDGHWVQALGGARARLTKAMRSPGNCLLLQVDYPLSHSLTWHELAWDIAASMERVRMPE